MTHTTHGHAVPPGQERGALRAAPGTGPKPTTLRQGTTWRRLLAALPPEFKSAERGLPRGIPTFTREETRGPSGEMQARLTKPTATPNRKASKPGLHVPAAWNPSCSDHCNRTTERYFHLPVRGV